jgi:hypothetical protein
MAFDRYLDFKMNGEMKFLPFITIQEQPTDIKVVYSNGISRLDIISNKYYDDPTYGWLIQLANPQYGSIEFDYPQECILRIPFPLESAISLYNKEIQKYFDL